MSQQRPKWLEDLKAPLVVLGYHGTSLSSAERIISEGFALSRNDWDWLGEGVYFWQDAPLRALEWSKICVQIAVRDVGLISNVRLVYSE